LETTGEAGPFFPEMHYDAALTHLDEILQFHDIRSIITLLLLAIYCLRAPGGPGAWTYIGLAMRICTDLGLHRRTRKERLDVETEMRKRIFWTCYFLDRQVSIVLGGPFAISDHDIDLPVSRWESFPTFRFQPFNVKLFLSTFLHVNVVYSCSPSTNFNITVLYFNIYSTSNPFSPCQINLSIYILIHVASSRSRRGLRQHRRVPCSCG
jgi:hypothetical protein